MISLTLRVAQEQDFEFCERLYFEEMSGIILELKLDMARQVETFKRLWQPLEVRIVEASADIGWLQTREETDAIFLCQLYVARNYQRRGIGTQVMRVLIEESERAGKGMTLGVVKINPAVRLYQRLGFQIVREDDYKFHMRRDCATA